MMMSLYKSGQDNFTRKIEHRIRGRRKLFVFGDLPDDSVLGVQAGVFQFMALAVYPHKDLGVFCERGGHGGMNTGLPNSAPCWEG